MLPEIGGENTTIRLDAILQKKLRLMHVMALNYSFPEGTWRVIAFGRWQWGQTNIAAAPKPMTIVDHLDSQKVLKLYNYLFGERTGLQPYFGNQCVLSSAIVMNLQLTGIIL
jgi:hypothetical protein